MAQKINPISLRLGKTNRDFDCCWYNNSNYVYLLIRDFKIKNYINTILKKIDFSSARLLTTSLHNKIKINIFFCNPSKSRHLLSQTLRVAAHKKIKNSKKNLFTNNYSVISKKQDRVYNYLTNDLLSTCVVSKENKNKIYSAFNSSGLYNITYPVNPTGLWLLGNNCSVNNKNTISTHYGKHSFSIEKINQLWIRYFISIFFSRKIYATHNLQNSNLCIENPIFLFNKKSAFISLGYFLSQILQLKKIILSQKKAHSSFRRGLVQNTSVETSYTDCKFYPKNCLAATEKASALQGQQSKKKAFAFFPAKRIGSFCEQDSDFYSINKTTATVSKPSYIETILAVDENFTNNLHKNITSLDSTFENMLTSNKFIHVTHKIYNFVRTTHQANLPILSIKISEKLKALFLTDKSSANQVNFEKYNFPNIFFPKLYSNSMCKKKFKLFSPNRFGVTGRFSDPCEVGSQFLRTKNNSLSFAYIYPADKIYNKSKQSGPTSCSSCSYSQATCKFYPCFAGTASLHTATDPINFLHTILCIQKKKACYAKIYNNNNFTVVTIIEKIINKQKFLSINKLLGENSFSEKKKITAHQKHENYNILSLINMQHLNKTYNNFCNLSDSSRTYNSVFRAQPSGNKYPVENRNKAIFKQDISNKYGVASFLTGKSSYTPGMVPDKHASTGSWIPAAKNPLAVSLIHRIKQQQGAGLLTPSKLIIPNGAYKHHLESMIFRSLSCHVNLQFFKTPNIFQSSLYLINELVYYIEKKVPFFKLKNSILRQLTQQKSLRIKGIRVMCSGRVGGKSKKAQKAKIQSFKYGETSLHMFSSKIDFKAKSAFTNFGTLGIKVWICFL